MIEYNLNDLLDRKVTFRKKVTWYEFNIDDYLPNNWREDLKQWSINNATHKKLIPTSVTSRESEINPIAFAAVNGTKVRKHKKWLFDYYESLFHACAQLCYENEVIKAKNDKYAVNINVKGKGMRYEAHVDSNPVEVLLYATDHPLGFGGELVVTPNVNANGISQIDENCEIIHPQSGKLLIFDFRTFPHYVRPLTSNDYRIAVAMNYYTHECTEDMRPPDLDKHLYGI